MGTGDEAAKNSEYVMGLKHMRAMLTYHHREAVKAQSKAAQGPKRPKKKANFAKRRK